MNASGLFDCRPVSARVGVSRIAAATEFALK